MHANAGVDAYETPRRGRIKGATKAKSECVRFPLTLTQMLKRSSSLRWIDLIGLLLIVLCIYIILHIV